MRLTGLLADGHARDVHTLVLRGITYGSVPRRTLPSCRHATTTIDLPSFPTSLTHTPCNLTSGASSSLTAPFPDTKQTQRQIQRWKDRERGGQNLSARWQRLERSLRGKGAYGAHRDALIGQASAGEGEGEQKKHAGVVISGGKAYGKRPRLFKGLVVPEEPKEPESDECCMSGCAICVYDLYEAAREDYARAVDALRSALDTKGVSEDEWPLNIRRKPAQKEKKEVKSSARDVTLSAFEELERSLRAKQQEAAGAGPDIKGPPARRSPARPVKTRAAPVVSELYEGIRWIVFGNR
ncbi:hypothetical protein WOLCODRAFT_165432 [Wolfiporia cocos MD-104 SS10]|uniref:Oxidoreductase-like domain-containing protein n=1 Tax=Wolfiporia cocos (strain MD-104) TaxID=742152 RepID=A0A2H3JRQ4_WOLCO|nr:hypothetical protein WOLCODRAFT_165432 [Wolfiporia cocos MD-104 SS10]